MSERLWARFWAKVDVGGRGDCWMWLGCRDTNGYGRFSVSPGGGAKRKLIHSHRIALQLVGREVPTGMHTDHLCRNRLCVNPAHLEVVTPRTNILRGTGLTARHAVATHCPQGHPYSGDNLYITPKGDRDCRACRRVANSRYQRQLQEVGI
jgi:hypothetical protein